MAYHGEWNVGLLPAHIATKPFFDAPLMVY